MDSEAARKNQPPPKLIIPFHTSGIIPPGTSSRQNRCHLVSRMSAGRLVEVAGLGDQRVVERERHVPRLRGEDGEDRRALEAELGAGEQVMNAVTVHRQEPEHRDRLQDVEQRDQHLLRPPQPGRRRRVDEGEDERQDQSAMNIRSSDRRA